MDTTTRKDWYDITVIFQSQHPLSRSMGYFTTARWDNGVWIASHWYRQSERDEPVLQASARYDLYGNPVDAKATTPNT